MIRFIHFQTLFKFPKYQGPWSITLDFSNLKHVAFYNILYIPKKVSKYINPVLSYMDIFESFLVQNLTYFWRKNGLISFNILHFFTLYNLLSGLKLFDFDITW